MTRLRPLLATFALLCLCLTAWALILPTHFRATFDRVFGFVEEGFDESALRGLGIVAVGIGVMLIYTGLVAL